MLSYQTKYQLKSFAMRNYFILRTVIAVFLIATSFFIIALLNYLDDNSIGSFSENLMSILVYLTAPSSLDLFFSNSWTIITSFFCYSNYFQLLSDALLILISGNLFLQFLSQKKMIWSLVWGHLIAFLFFIMPTTLFSQLDPALLADNSLGLSGAAYGILFTAIAYRPNFKIPILKYEISLQTIAIVLLALNILSINKLNFLTISSHFGGAIAGIILGIGYGKQWIPIFGKKKMTYSYGNKTRRPIQDDEYNAKRADEERILNKILDKISKSGYDHLSEEEKKFLFNFKRK